MNLAFDPCLLSASSENIPDHISYTQHSISLLKFSAVLFFCNYIAEKREKNTIWGALLCARHCDNHIQEESLCEKRLHFWQRTCQKPTIKFSRTLQWPHQAV